MKKKTVIGYEVRGGKITERTLFGSRAEASRHLAGQKGVRGFQLRWDQVVETLTTKRKGGKLRHQQIGGNGLYWEDWLEPFPTHARALAERIKRLRSRVTDRKQALRKAERELAKATK